MMTGHVSGSGGRWEAGGGERGGGCDADAEVKTCICNFLGGGSPFGRGMRQRAGLSAPID